jgi:hypothetical protein
MSYRFDEWVTQADYDMDTAEIMFTTGRFFMPSSCAIYLSKKR